MANVGMDLKEAEEFFKKYDGHGFHMFREEEGNYAVYQKLNISKDTEDRWRKEILDRYVQDFSCAQSGRQLKCLYRMRDIIPSLKSDLDVYCDLFVHCIKTTLTDNEQCRDAIIRLLTEHVKGRKSFLEFLQEHISVDISCF